MSDKQRQPENQYPSGNDGNGYPVYNSDSIAIPPYALLRVTGMQGNAFSVLSPNTNGQTNLLVNGKRGISPGRTGTAYNLFPAIVAYAQTTGATPDPVAGQTWGAVAGSYFLQAGQPGFSILSNGANGRVNVNPATPVFNQAVPAGPNGSAQYDNNGAFGGFGNWNNTTSIFSLAGSVSTTVGNIQAVLNGNDGGAHPFGAYFADTANQLYVYIADAYANFSSDAAIVASSSGSTVEIANALVALTAIGNGSSEITRLCDDRYAVNALLGAINAFAGFLSGSVPGVYGTTAEGDTVVGGIITALGSGGTPSPPPAPPPTAYPSVNAVLPSTGSTAGNATVTITGNNLLFASAAGGGVNFGTTPAASFVVNSSTSITAVTPAESAGTVDVTVTTPAGTSSTSAADHYTFVTPAATGTPTVSSLSGHFSTLAGGAWIQVTGTHFESPTITAVNVNGALVMAMEGPYSDTLVGIETPANAAGTYDVTVTNADGTSATSSADTITYVPVPTVTAVSPRTGTVAGGDSITITGTNFVVAAQSQTYVFFGVGHLAPSLTVNSTTSITAVTPAHSAGTVDVQVNIAGGVSSTSSADTFTFEPAHGSATIATTGSFVAEVNGSHTIGCYGSGQGGYGLHGTPGHGGAGGGYASSVLTLTAGETVTVTVGAVGAAGTTSASPGNGGDVWASTTGSAPTTSSQGALAPGGNSSTSAVGSTTYAGGSGGNMGGAAGGGGGGSASAAGAGAAGSAGSTGVGGAGGAGVSGAGGTGSATGASAGGNATGIGNGGGGQSGTLSGGTATAGVVVVTW